MIIDGVPCTMFRISYVGENGWEIYTRMEHGLKLWDAIWEAGQEFEICPVGIGVYAVTGHREGLPPDGRRARERVRPGRGRSRPPEGEVGRLPRQGGLPEGPRGGPGGDHARCRWTASVAPTGTTGSRPGQRADPHADGRADLGAKGRVSRVTTAGAGPSVGKYLLMAYLPPEHAVEGTKLQVMYMNERYPVTVERRCHAAVRSSRRTDEELTSACSSA
ncbi:MAG: glycine cleavage T C-terminal barrel domain-containing protein [Ilumatobacteraceae bacterium]